MTTLALLVALTSHATLPDARYLRRAADSAGVPALVVMAVAYTESGRNLRPTLAGAAEEVGRFQLKLQTAAAFCPGVNVLTYKGNVACFLAMFKRDVDAVGVERAVARHNGRAEGTAAQAYARKVLQLAHQWAWEAS